MYARTVISVAALLTACLTAHAAQLSTSARAAIPHETQQLLAIDYRAMQNSSAAMQLRERVMPPELKQFDEALRKSGLNDNHDVEQLVFVLFRPQSASGQGSSQGSSQASDKAAGNSTDQPLESVGIAQGQFAVQDIVASFRKQKLKPTLIRTNKVYPLVKTGMVACFVDASTMIFGTPDAVRAALDARDGVAPSLLTNAPMMDAMKSVDTSRCGP